MNRLKNRRAACGGGRSETQEVAAGLCVDLVDDGRVVAVDVDYVPL